MRIANIVIGQRINENKIQLARDLRRAATEAEKVLWQSLRRNQLNGMHFRRQQVIDGYVVDFYCHTHALIVEVDGGVHLEQAPYDAERDEALTTHGFRLLRVTNEEVLTDLEAVLERIRELAGAKSTR